MRYEKKGRKKELIPHLVQTSIRPIYLAETSPLPLKEGRKRGRKLHIVNELHYNNDIDWRKRKIDT